MNRSCRNLVAAAVAGLAALAAAPAVRAQRPTPAQPPTLTPTPTPPPPGEIRVLVTLSLDQKRSAAAGAAVWVPGSSAPPGAPAQTRRPAISSKTKRFDPRVLAVPAGTTVEFPNLDKIYHNVFSLSDAARFDLGLYRNGASKPWKFDRPGLVRVYCNIHPQMAAYLLVVDGRIYAQAGPDGEAVLTGVPPGRQPVKVWDERGGEWAGWADVPPGGTATLSVVLDAAGYKEQPHKNKHGKDYPPPDEDENRY